MSGIRSVDVIGFRTLLRFHLRRELVALVCWVGGTAALIGVQSVASQSFYDTPEELAALRETIGANPAVLAFAGPVELLENIGGEIVFQVFGYAAVVVALMSMLLVGRLTRTDEETGRTELIRSARVGRAAPVATALALAGVANLAVAVAVAVTAIATGLPVGGSVLTGVALAGVGCVFAAFLPGGAADAVNSYLALTLMITALLAAAHGVNGALRARREETSDRVELVVAARTDRLAWFAGHVAMAVGGATVVMLIGAAGEGLAHALASDDPGQIPRLVAASTVYLPGIWLMVGVAVAGMGLLPRLAAALAWTYVAYCVVTEVLGESFRLPDRMLLASPFRHLPQAPLDAVTPGGIIVVTLCAVIALAAGFVGLTRRDLG
ncbi:ABC-2 family transporter protein [Gordonia paraffinivorans]|uniref:ABC-2 family transporter protein n=1 Tax=Gordonia paraffinivorans TaxID=175628 RepID=A0ABD7UZJ8_9ACTN|nr:ABC transporter permease [Gordonia paraffinivorans]VFA82225.1 ABC-2 family transporter protein [Gordonia paraffinivorans]